jgi:type III restriction enzyme
MELNSYQKTVINDLTDFMGHFTNTSSFAEAYKNYWAAHRYKCPADNVQYFHNIATAPNVCLKVPTAGGKTFIAVNAIFSIFEQMHKDSHRVVVWLVPSDAIRTQTYNALHDIKHPYRQKLDFLFNKKVNVYQDEDLIAGGAGGFSPASVRECVNIIVLSYQALRITNTADRKIYQSNGNLSSFFSNVTGNENWLFKLDNGEYDSLVSVIRKYDPIVIIDEAHNARSPLSVEMLNNLKPSFVLEITATPRRSKKTKERIVESNIISYVGASALKREKMIKLPMIFHNLKNVNDVYAEAIILQKKLEIEAKQLNYYIRPIVLLQAQPKNQSVETETIQKIKMLLIEKYDIPEKHIGIKSSGIDTIKNEKLLDKTCEIRYIITIDALKEGWDCPFAYILASVANKTSEVQIEQLVGRVLRNPWIKTHTPDLLNMCYVLVSSSKFMEVLQKIILALNHQGIDEKEIKAITGNTPNLFDNNTENKAVSPNNDLNNDDDNKNDDAINEHQEDSNKDNTDVFSNANGAVEDLIKDAKNAYGTDQTIQNKEIAQGILPIATEQQQPLIQMHQEYQDLLNDTKLPQFFIEVDAIKMFADKEWKFLSQRLLLNKFRLCEAGINDLSFDAVDADIFQIDQQTATTTTPTNASMVEDKAFVYVKANENQQKMFLDAISLQAPETQIKSLIGRIKKDYFKDYLPVSDADIEKYLKSIIDRFNSEALEHFKQYMPRYAEKIKKHADSKRAEYALREFEKGVEQRIIKTEPSFVFPNHLQLKEAERGISKSIYNAYPKLNDFERKFAADIASLDNVICWHKFNDRNNKDYTQAFMLNGAYFNHYPDFVIFLKSGLIIIAETKGRLDTDDQKKNLLGKKWQEVAGRDKYVYYMVTQEQTGIAETLYFPEFIEIIKRL